MSDVAKGPGWTLHLGRWQDVLKDVEADAMIVDPPYSERTHGGHDEAIEQERLSGEEKRTRIDKRTGAIYSVGVNRRRVISYEAWSEDDIAELCAGGPDVKGWRVILTDHEMLQWWEPALAFEDLYVFAPLPFVAPGSRVRLAGDGPSSWTCWIIVARPRHEPYSKWGTLPGAYVLPKGEGDPRGSAFIGGKPLWLSRALVRDYSRTGDLIVDPCAGSATTLLAAVIEGRRAIGAEMDPETFDLARRRLEQGITPDMFAAAEERTRPRQRAPKTPDLFEGTTDAD